MSWNSHDQSTNLHNPHCCNLRKFNTTQELTPWRWTGLHQLQTRALTVRKTKTPLKKHNPFTSQFILKAAALFSHRGLRLEHIKATPCQTINLWGFQPFVLQRAVAVGFSRWLVSLGTFPMTTNVTPMQCHPWPALGSHGSSTTLRLVVYLGCGPLTVTVVNEGL